MNNDIQQLSRFLSLILRHKPETIGIALDSRSWADKEKALRKRINKGKMK